VPPEGVTTTRLGVGTPERQVSLTDALGLRAFGARLLTLQPRQRNRVHRHRRQEELYVVVDGELTIAFEGGEELTLQRDEVALVRPDVRRQLMNRGTEPVSVLAVGGAGEHEGGDGEAFTDWSSDEPHPPPEVPIPEDLPE
jgi:uncharacterized cupin superfamily protein